MTEAVTAKRTFEFEREDSTRGLVGRYRADAGSPGFSQRLAYFGHAAAWRDAVGKV